MSRLTIYCEQYGYYWSFTPKEFLALCNRSIQNKPGGFELPRKNQIKRKPATVYHLKGQRHGSSGSPNTILFHPLDWNRSDYREAAVNIMNKLREINRHN
jgi:hypothetical protein